MSDEFLKIVKEVQQTGKAPQPTKAETSTTTSSAKIVQEGLNPSTKYFRFVQDSRKKEDE